MSTNRPKPASPACLAHEADDAYMGYATREELGAFLNELLDAERAGDRRWSDMLQRHLQALAIAPSTAMVVRGPADIVRRLRNMLPKVRDDALHRDLRAMLSAYEAMLKS